MIFGAIFDKFIPDTNPKFELYDKTMRKNLEHGLPMFFGLALPLFKNFSFVKQARQGFMETHDQLLEWMKSDLEESLANFAINNDNNNSNNETNSTNVFSHILFDDYVIRNKKKLGTPSQESKTRNTGSTADLAKRRLEEDLLMLVVAGMDTTAHTFEVGVCLLAKYQDIQEMLYQVKH